MSFQPLIRSFCLLLHLIVASTLGVLWVSPVAAADCSYLVYTMVPFADPGWRSGCVVSGTDVSGWNSYGTTISTHTGQISTHSGQISTLNSDLNALEATVAGLSSSEGLTWEVLLVQLEPMLHALIVIGLVITFALGYVGGFQTARAS